MIASELDVLPELWSGELLLLPLKNKGVVALEISVVIDLRRPRSRAARPVSEVLVTRTSERLSAARGEAVSPDRS